MLLGFVWFKKINEFIVVLVGFPTKKLSFCIVAAYKHFFGNQIFARPLCSLIFQLHTMRITSKIRIIYVY